MKDYAGLKRKSRFARYMGGDARTVLTLLCVGLFLTAVAFFSCVLRSTDNLVMYVPKDVKAYVHYRRLPWNDYTLLKKAFAIPAHLEPREAAVFSRQDENGDLVWGTLLMWDSDDAVRIDERLTLNEIATARLDRKTYLIGDLGVVQHHEQSLIYTEKGRAYKTMLSISRAQALFSSDIFVSAAYRDDNPSQTLIASLREKDGALLASVQASAGAHVLGGLLGEFRADDDQTVMDFAVPNSATIAVSSLSDPVFDAMQLLFADLKKLTTTRGTPLNSALRDAESELHRLFSSPSTLTLFADIDGATEFILHYPTIDPSTLMDATSRFLQAALPESTHITLPDGDRAWELKIDPEASTFEPVIGLDNAQILAPDTGISLIIASAPFGGTLMGTSIEPLKTYLQDEIRTPDVRCGKPRGHASYFNNDPNGVFEELDIPGNPLSTLKITEMLVTKTGDNSLFFCGLVGGNVDNIEAN